MFSNGLGSGTGLLALRLVLGNAGKLGTGFCILGMTFQGQENNTAWIQEDAKIWSWVKSTEMVSTRSVSW